MNGLLVIDMLNDFIREGKKLEVPKGRDIIPQIERSISKARSHGIDVIYAKDTHSEEDEELDNWPPHCLEGTEGSKVIDELEPEDQDLEISKHGFSSFRGTNLDQELRERGIEELILVGVLSDICILHTSIDAYYKGYDVTVLEDCVATLSEDRHNFALKHIDKVLGFDVIELEDLFD